MIQPNQEYAAVAYVGHTGKNLRIPMCIKGVWDSLESCEEQIKKLVEMDDTYDILPVPLYRWLPCDPDISKIRNVYTNEKLNSLIEGTEHEAQEAKRFHAVYDSANIDILQKPFDADYQGKGVMPFGSDDNNEIVSASQLLSDLERT
jgi:hypothetical protein